LLRQQAFFYTGSLDLRTTGVCGVSLIIFENFMKQILKYVLAVLITIAFTSLGAQPKLGTVYPSGKPGVDYNKKDAKGKRDGLWVQQWKDTRNLLYKGQYSHGKPVGMWERYYPDGALASTINHVQDTTIIDAVFYHSNGVNKASEGRFVKKKKEGNWKIWSESGALVSDENFRDSLLDGTCKYFFENGKILKIETFKLGMPEGPFTEFYENGKKKSEGSYAGGEKDGAFKQWFESGTLDCEGKYYKGLQDGMWYYNYPNGKPKMAVLYKRGAETKRKYENGTFKEYYESLIPKSEYSYENGLRNGPFIEWYDVGQYTQAPATDEDREMGIVYREKLEGTQVRMKGDYVDDKLEGEVIYYRENGAIEKVEEWVEGKCIKTREVPK
jgi:antitoxin component YwqK of YwqJK toxin-antitoxin module